MTRPTGGKNGRPKGRIKTHCVRGHERTPENLIGHNCRTCMNDRKRQGRKAQALPRAKRIAKRRERIVLVPAEPLFALLNRLGISVRDFGPRYSRLTGAQPETGARSLHRARETGSLTIDMADVACLALGRHPFEVYGPEWFTYGAKEVADAV